MKEDDIRPAELRKKCEELFLLDASELLEKTPDFVEVGCPACDCDISRIEFDKHGYRFKKCKKCRTLYISPRPTPEILKNYYATSRASKFWQEEMYPSSRDMRIEKIYRPRVKMIADLAEKYKMGSDLMLDIGAGSGDFGMEMARKNVFKKIILVEPGPIRIKPNPDIGIIRDVAENLRLEQKPDVITIFELIEHLFSPAEFIKSVYNLLHDNSFCILTLPNMEGLELLTIYDKSINVAGPDHLNYFNIESIKILLKKIGFSRIEVSTPGELDADLIRNRHMEGVINISDQPFLNYMLIEKPELFLEPFQCFLKQNNLSSSMLVLAQK